MFIFIRYFYVLYNIKLNVLKTYLKICFYIKYYNFKHEHFKQIVLKKTIIWCYTLYVICISYYKKTVSEM